LIYEIDAPEWRKLQLEIEEAEMAGAFVGRRLQAGKERVESVRGEIALLEERINKLEGLHDAVGGRASELSAAKSSLAQARSDLASAEEENARMEMESIRLKTSTEAGKPNARFAQALAQASTWTGLPEEELLKEIASGEGRLPRWKSMKVIEVYAMQAGRIETLSATTGGLVKEGDLILSSVDESNLMFRARGLQSDLGVLKSGQRAMIVPPQGGTLHLQDAMQAELHIGMEADPRERVIDLLLYPETLALWARPGVSAHAEVVIDETAHPEKAIPLSCVVTDGIEKVFFLRDRKDPDQAVRMTADLGVSDGRWVVVRSGLKAGDEVVLDGAYELKLTGAGKSEEGGHFHSDGTFHEAH
jgi:hypothetical protein